MGTRGACAVEGLTAGVAVVGGVVPAVAVGGVTAVVAGGSVIVVMASSPFEASSGVTSVAVAVVSVAGAAVVAVAFGADADVVASSADDPQPATPAARTPVSSAVPSARRVVPAVLHPVMAGTVPWVAFGRPVANRRARIRAVTPALRYEGHELFRFPGRGAFDWIDVKRFALEPPDLPGADALALLIGHDRFRDTYATATSHDEDGGELHGPYRLRCIEPASYERVDGETGLRILSTFARKRSTDEDVATREAVVIARVAPLLDAADDCYRLRDLGQDAAHDFGFILDDFTELVVVDRSAGRLAVIAAAED